MEDGEESIISEIDCGNLNVECTTERKKTEFEIRNKKKLAAFLKDIRKRLNDEVIISDIKPCGNSFEIVIPINLKTKSIKISTELEKIGVDYEKKENHFVVHLSYPRKPGIWEVIKNSNWIIVILITMLLIFVWKSPSYVEVVYDLNIRKIAKIADF